MLRRVLALDHLPQLWLRRLARTKHPSQRFAIGWILFNWHGAKCNFKVAAGGLDAVKLLICFFLIVTLRLGFLLKVK